MQYLNCVVPPAALDPAETAAISGREPVAGWRPETVATRRPQRGSLDQGLVSEIEAWARHALAANGFGDY